MVSNHIKSTTHIINNLEWAKYLYSNQGIFGHYETNNFSQNVLTKQAENFLALNWSFKTNSLSSFMAETDQSLKMDDPREIETKDPIIVEWQMTAF